MAKLVETVDNATTAKEVRDFLKSEAIRILFISQFDVYQAAPEQLNRVPMTGRPLTDDVVGYANSLIEALMSLDERKRVMIWRKYILKDTHKAIRCDTHLSVRRAHEIIREGLIEFAVAFRDTYDLVVTLEG
ncbi:hypothetical protein [Weissella sp. MSCH1]|uniref:hypothetical protein n=1 Tax=Weissella sp. MSCH1 TaxID=3383343 RepID=UPI003896E2EC